MSYEPDTLLGVIEFCEREGQPCESVKDVRRIVSAAVSDLEGSTRGIIPKQALDRLARLARGPHEVFGDPWGGPDRSGLEPSVPQPLDKAPQRE